MALLGSKGRGGERQGEARDPATSSSTSSSPTSSRRPSTRSRASDGFVTFGITGSVAIALGTVLLLLAVLRVLQTETGAFHGNLSWVPYLIVAVLAVAIIGLSAWRIVPRPGRSAGRPPDQRLRRNAMAVETNGRRISRDDLQAAFAGAIGEGQESVRPGRRCPSSRRSGRHRRRVRSPSPTSPVDGGGGTARRSWRSAGSRTSTWTICSAAC